MSEKEKNRESNQKKFDLRERLIDYEFGIIKVFEKLPETKTGKHISSQILEAELHLLPIAERNKVLKQSETLRMVLIFAMVVNGLPLRRFSTIRKAIEVWLKIIVGAKLIQPIIKLSPLLQETDELISILFKSIDTAKKKNER